MKSFSETEIITLWRRVLGFDPTRTDCTVEAVDGIGIDEWIRPRIRQWYLNLLDTAPARLLPVNEFGRAAGITVMGHSIALITTPDSARRVISLKLQGWSRAIVPVAESLASDQLARLASPYGKPGNGNPLAVIRADGSILAAPVDIPVVESLRAVADTSPGTYTFDESLIASIPKLNNLQTHTNA